LGGQGNDGHSEAKEDQRPINEMKRRRRRRRRRRFNTVKTKPDLDFILSHFNPMVHSNIYSISLATWCENVGHVARSHIEGKGLHGGCVHFQKTFS
jgi:hypothetical protein